MLFLSSGSGACLVVRREAYWEAGGLDADFFAHQEEIDLCWRLLLNSGKIYSIPASVVYHVGGATLHKSSPQKPIIILETLFFTLYKNLPKRELFPIIFIRLCLDGLAGVRFILQLKLKHCFAIVMRTFFIYKKIPKLKKKRKLLVQTSIERLNTSIVKLYFINGTNRFNQL